MPGYDITTIYVVAVNNSVNEFLENLVKKRIWSAMDQLPPGTKNIAELPINRIF